MPSLSFHDKMDKIKALLSPLLEMEKFNNPLIRKRILYCAMTFFVGGIILSLKAQPDILQNVSAGPVIPIILFTLISFCLATQEFLLTVNLCGKKLSFFHAFETIVMGNAANMLPLPGNVMVKVSRLKSIGIHYKHGTSVTILMAVSGLGIVFTYAGFWLVWLSLTEIGILLLGMGVVILLLTCLQFSRLFGRQRAIILKLVIIRFLQIILHGARFFFCLLALGITGGFAQASVLTVSSVLSSIIAIVPAGLGIQEILAAGIGPLIGLTAASAFLISSLNRILEICTVFILSGGLTIYEKKIQ